MALVHQVSRVSQDGPGLQICGQGLKNWPSWLPSVIASRPKLGGYQLVIVFLPPLLKHIKGVRSS